MRTLKFGTTESKRELSRYSTWKVKKTGERIKIYILKYQIELDNYGHPIGCVAILLIWNTFLYQFLASVSVSKNNVYSLRQHCLTFLPTFMSDSTELDSCKMSEAFVLVFHS